LAGLEEIIDSKAPAEVAILFDYENWWAVEYDQRPSENLKYLEQLRNFYNPLFDMNISVDIVPIDADLAQYKLVIAPLLYMVKSGLKDHLETYVANGGSFVTTFFSGIVDETDGVFPGGYPGPLKDLLGLRVEEFDPLEPHMTNKMKMTKVMGNLNGEYPCNLWCDVVLPGSAEVLANFTEDYHAGCPCLTGNHFGKGEAWIVCKIIN
jgi:beta-galactosidase